MIARLRGWPRRDFKITSYTCFFWPPPVRHTLHTRHNTLALLPRLRLQSCKTSCPVSANSALEEYCPTVSLP